MAKMDWTKDRARMFAKRAANQKREGDITEVDLRSRKRRSRKRPIPKMERPIPKMELRAEAERAWAQCKLQEDQGCIVPVRSLVLVSGKAKMKFVGTLQQLKDRFSNLGVSGTWWHAHGYHELRTDDEVVVHWWPSTKTIVFQGRRAPAAKLKFRFREAADQILQEPVTIYRVDKTARDRT